MSEPRIIQVYAESTPNPASMKFVLNTSLLREGSVEYKNPSETAHAPLARKLFGFSGITGVFITANYITLTKAEGIDWYEIMGIMRTCIKSYVESGEPIFTGPREQASDPEIGRTHSASAMESKIIETLDEYVRPAVEMDGGAIIFKSFDNGVVTLIMKGACNGCPSSSITLKSGIENLLKRLVPGVTEVVAETV
ncbi:MAG: NifU family protein [Bacteroidia bacterium]|nr:NifU family protein [Bacteroidia bacterium]